MASSDSGSPAACPPRPELNAATTFVDRHLREGRGQKNAIRTSAGDVTYLELVHKVNRCGRLLQRLGLARGDRLLMILPDCEEFFYLFWGAIKSGVVPVPVNGQLRTDDFRFLIRDSECSAVAWAREHAAAVEPALADFPSIRSLPIDGKDDSVMARMSFESSELEPCPCSAKTPCFWLYSSGSTGRPKAAVHSHGDLAATAVLYAEGVLGATDQDVFFSAARLFFAYGLGNTLIFPLWVGGTTVLSRSKPTVYAIFETIERFRPTLFFGVPTHYVSLLAALKTERRDWSSVRLCVSAGEALPVEVLSRFKEETGLVILDGVGSTEALHIYISNRPNDVRPGTSGRVVPGYRVRILNERELPAAPGEVGRLQLAGPSIATHYWNDPEKTRETMKGEWLETGDSYYCDEQGYYHFSGRSDEMLKIGGIWSSPVEIELPLLSHPQVRDAAVTGALDANGLTEPIAWVVLEDGSLGDDALAAELLRHCQSRLAPYQVPRRIYFLLDLPRTATGKVQRFRLTAPSHDRTSAPRLVSRFTGPPASRALALSELVSVEIAAVLRRHDASSVNPRDSLAELGLDSMSALELRNRLELATGLRLGATLLFDHPTPAALSRFLETQLHGTSIEGGAAVGASLGEVEHDPVVIVAMSCRYPGGVETPEDLWELLMGERDATSGFPETRGWDLETLYDANPETLGRSYTLRGGFLRDPDGFDPSFFGISPREAVAIDPQQRLLLEVSWEALERAGIDPASVQGSETGVFVGVMYSDYGARVSGASSEHEGHLFIGSAPSVASGRIAYTFGLHGPAITVDTACSSSLVAIHLACQALRRGECTLALAGGATVMATPVAFVEFCRQHALAPDGRCKSFAAGADGAGWAEGVGMLLLERLSDARRSGHPVLAVLRGSAVNQDGKSQGLTAPNGPAQERLIRRALEDARLDAADVDVVEAHGTGTRLGDPIEARALFATYGKGRADHEPIWLGSLKSNVGHAQAAAGVGGIIKMVLALEKGVLPKTLHAAAPSPHVDWSLGTLRLLNEPVTLPETGIPHRAAVSSFGISGTNAHVILEEAPKRAPTSPPDFRPLMWPVLLSGKTEAALFGQAARLRDHLHRHSDLSVGDVAYSLATGRSHFEHRAALAADDGAALAAALDGLAHARPSSATILGRAGQQEKVAVLFTGQGSQRAAMGRELYGAFDAFREHLDEVCAELDPRLERPLREVLFAPDGSPLAKLLDETEFTQPALFALEVAMFRLLEGFGLAPDLLLGHSVGELAAAHVAGVFSLSDACTLVTARASLMQALRDRGAMVSVQADEHELAPFLAGCEERVSIAALNGAGSLVVSGDEETVLAIAHRFEQFGRKVTRLRVHRAFHSPQMEPMLADFRRVAQDVIYSPCRIPIISNLTGRRASDDELGSPEYWVRHARHTVRFADGVRAVNAEGIRTFLELGPAPLLCGLARDVLGPGAHSSFASLLRKGHREVDTLVAAMGELHVRGVRLDWSRIFEPFALERVLLPTYAFQRQRYWLDAPARTQLEPSASASRFWSAVERDDVRALGAELDLTDEAHVRAISELLPKLSAWRRRQNRPSGPDAFRYRVFWQPVDLPAPTDAAGTWLIVLPTTVDGGFADRVVGVLTLRGARVVILRIDSEHAGREVLRSRLHAALGDSSPVRGVLSLVAPDQRVLARSATVPAGLGITLALTQALAGLRAKGPLWLVTRGAVSIGPADLLGDLSQSMIWGFGQVVALEHPDFWGGLVDVGDTDDPNAFEALADAILGAAGEDQLAVRSSGSFARRLVRAGVATGQVKRAFEPRGTVLITGGTGGLGSHVARWLARLGAEHLLLASRRGLEAPSAAGLRAELTALGARVTIARCDVSDREATRALLEGIAPEHPLRAIFHAAGILEKALLVHASPEQLAPLLATKVDAGLHLHELTRNRELDAFVLFSSVAATFGSLGLSGYSAANAFLDALAQERRALGLRATSVAWGPWQGSGMVTERLAEAVGRQGLAPMQPELALNALEQALERDDALVTVADIDWSRFAPSVRASTERSLLRHFPEAQPSLARPTARSPLAQGHGERSDSTDSVLALRSSAFWLRERPQALNELRTRVREAVARVLGNRDATAVEEDQDFAKLGLDSLMAITLRSHLEELLHLSLSPSVAFEYPTIEHLVRHLASLLEPARGEALEPSTEGDASVRLRDAG